MPYLNANNIKIYYETIGPETAPALVLLEGWGFDS
jgi:hypothetical protein